MVRGCDIWVNVPRPPLEASGTSGIKSGGQRRPAAERARRLVARGLRRHQRLGDRRRGRPRPRRPGLAPRRRAVRAADRRGAAHLLRARRERLPTAWLAMVRAALRTIGPDFGAGRMVRDYVERIYPEVTAQRVEGGPARRVVRPRTCRARGRRALVLLAALAAPAAPPRAAFKGANGTLAYAGRAQRGARPAPARGRRRAAAAGPGPPVRPGVLAARDADRVLLAGRDLGRVRGRAEPARRSRSALSRGATRRGRRPATSSSSPAATRACARLYAVGGRRHARAAAHVRRRGRPLARLVRARAGGVRRAAATSWSCPPRGGATRHLTTGGADDRAPSWSPDGRRIAFTRLAERRPPPKKRKGKKRRSRRGGCASCA